MPLLNHTLKDGRILTIREAEPEDAAELLRYVEGISGESDFLSFGPGEFVMTEEEEAAFLRSCQDAQNTIYLIGLVDGEIVATSTFTGDRRPRIRHRGQFGLSVRRDCWRVGVGSIMTDALIDWARGTGIVKKINLQVRADNEGAIELYRRKGFVHEGSISRDICVEGVYYDHLCMGLAL